MQVRRIYNRLKSYIYSKLYQQETGFMLNYLTLHIANSTIANQLKEHRAAQFKRIFGIFFILSVLAFIYNIVVYLTVHGHPLLVVTSALTLSEYTLFFYWYYKGTMWKATYLCVPYLLFHAVASVCCYRGWLPPKLQIPNKDIFDFQILVNFIFINVLPLIEIRWTVFGMVPILLVSTYLQVTV